MEKTLRKLLNFHRRHHGANKNEVWWLIMHSHHACIVGCSFVALCWMRPRHYIMLCHPTLFKQLVSSAVLSWIVQVYPHKGPNRAETSQVVLWVCIYIRSFFLNIFSCNTVTNSARNFQQETQLLESHNTIYIHTYLHTYIYTHRVSFSFLPKGWQNEIVWINGRQVCIRVQSMWQIRGVWGHAPLGNFWFWTFY